MRGFRGWWILCLCVLWSGCSKTSSSVSQASYCEVPAEGVKVQGSITSLPAQYELSRSGQVFTATIHAKFIDHNAETSSGHFAAGMLARAEACAAEVQPYLVGPQGETLKIQFAREGANPLPITVTSEAVRGHYRLWQSKWTCAQIMHEVFHILGLVDEYAEQSNSCRAVGPSDSIMADPEGSYVSIFYTRTRRSLLYPAQFNTIIAPGCQSKNSLYYSCASKAYQGPSCGSVAEECSAGPGDWLNH